MVFLRGAPPLLSVFVLLLPVILALHAPSGFAQTALERLLNSNTSSADYPRRIHRLSEESERVIVHAGIGAMMLMNQIDDEVDFGGSDYWTVEIGTRGSTSIACALGGGIDATATRDDYRSVSGSLNFNGCMTTLGRISGAASFAYDDAVWLDPSNPKTDYALTISLMSLEIEGRDGRTYRIGSGQAYCDSKVNHPLERYEVDPVTGYVTRYIYGRDADRPLLSQYEDFSGYTFGNNGWEVEDALGQLKENVVENKPSCDIKNTSVEVDGQVHSINDLKFSSSTTVYGDSGQVNYHVSMGRTDRLGKIGSGLAAPGGAPDGGRFRHAEFGLLEVASGRRFWGDWARAIVADERYPAGFRVDYAFFRNSYGGGENWWSLESGRLVGGDNRYTLDDLDENGTIDGYEVIDNSFFLSRQKCALSAHGDAEGTHYLEADRSGDLPDPIRALRSEAGCISNNHWLVTNNLDGSFRASYQSDDDGDGIEKLYDDDDDNDGVSDLLDAFPNDSSETTDTDLDGIGNNADADDDNDDVPDRNDSFPLDASESIDTDQDGVGNNADPDDDGDGYNDKSDAFPLDSSEWLDSDRDGVGNNKDEDDDNDGLTDDQEKAFGTNGQLADTDQDGMDDGLEVQSGLDPLDDSDCPHWHCPKVPRSILIIASENFDLDRDGLTKIEEEALGTNYRESDSDSDGLKDGEEAAAGSNPLAQDTDGDGLWDGREVELGSSPVLVDSDGDSMSDGDEVNEGSDPSDSFDCPRWFCGGGILPAVLGSMK